MAVYPDFVKTCGYGSVTGIGGANCRHSFWPFIEGVSERSYSDEELANIDPPPITFEGRTYTAYEATQMQRRLERTIRKQKRRKAALEAAGLTEDAQAANIRLRRLNQTYKQFSKAAGLPEQRERMRVLYGDNISSSGKCAGESIAAEPGKPVQIATVDFSDKRAVLEQLDIAQKETAGLDYEVSYSVTTDGKVWRVSGESATVHPEAIPSSLQGSYAYHNHPAEKTWYSFSADDVKFFFQHGEAYSKASDHVYEYIMERTPETLVVDPDLAYHMFKGILQTDVYSLSDAGKINIDADGFHEVMCRLSKKYHFLYERRKL